MAVFATPELGFIIGSVSLCKTRAQAFEIPHKGKPLICWRIITEEEYGIMAARGAGGVSLSQPAGGILNWMAQHKERRN